MKYLTLLESMCTLTAACNLNVSINSLKTSKS